MQHAVRALVLSALILVVSSGLTPNAPGDGIFGAVVEQMVTPPAAAQECDFCDYEGGVHWFTGDECTGQGGCKDCSFAPLGHIGCHAAPQPERCFTHAVLCDDAPEVPDDAELLSVIADRDVDRASEFISAGGLRLNADRRALQVIGCKGTVIGHLPIEAAFFADLTALAQLEEAAAG